jgi:hypothetical protein
MKRLKQNLVLKSIPDTSHRLFQPSWENNLTKFEIEQLQKKPIITDLLSNNPIIDLDFVELGHLSPRLFPTDLLNESKENYEPKIEQYSSYLSSSNNYEIYFQGYPYNMFQSQYNRKYTFLSSSKPKKRKPLHRNYIPLKKRKISNLPLNQTKLKKKKTPTKILQKNDFISSFNSYPFKKDSSITKSLAYIVSPTIFKVTIRPMRRDGALATIYFPSMITTKYWYNIETTSNVNLYVNKKTIFIMVEKEGEYFVKSHESYLILKSKGIKHIDKKIISIFNVQFNKHTRKSTNTYYFMLKKKKSSESLYLSSNFTLHSVRQKKENDFWNNNSVKEAKK